MSTVRLCRISLSQHGMEGYMPTEVKALAWNNSRRKLIQNIQQVDADMKELKDKKCRLEEQLQEGDEKEEHRKKLRKADNVARTCHRRLKNMETSRKRRAPVVEEPELSDTDVDERPVAKRTRHHYR